MVNLDGGLIGGHQRKRILAMMDGYGPDSTVDVRVPDRQLTPQEAEELAIRLNKNIAGEWDMDLLANEFELGDLIDWGFDDFDLGMGVTDDKAKFDFLGEQQDTPDAPEQKAFPLAIVLTASEHARWQAYKVRVKAKEDYAAFQRLMETADGG